MTHVQDIVKLNTHVTLNFPNLLSILPVFLSFFSHTFPFIYDMDIFTYESHMLCIDQNEKLGYFVLLL